MKSSHFSLLILACLFFSCKKYNDPIILPEPSPVPIPTILLKEIVIPNLPSPFYHFEYDSTGKASFVSYASDMSRYNISYNGGKIKEMRNDIFVNKDRLQYNYDNTGRLVAVNYADSTGSVYARIKLTYDGAKLLKLVRDRKGANGFSIEKTMSFSYHPDGNLLEITDHRSSRFDNSTFIDHFEQYDNKVNVDGFTRIHNEFFDHLVLLPEVRLQKNNPGKYTHTGDGVHFKIDYTYNYNDKNAPLVKFGNFMITSGTDSGKTFLESTSYSYY